MRQIIRVIFFLVVLAGLGLLGMAIFSDLPAPREEITIPLDTM